MTNRCKHNSDATPAGPDQLAGSSGLTCAFVNLYGYEHNYRARGGHSMGTGDCTDRRTSATG